MKRGMEKFIKKVVNKVHVLFGENSGKMLLLTGIIGMALSSLAQTLTVVNNKHYTLSQKMFMVPQELIDGAVSIFSLVLITTPLQNLAKKYVKNGKLLTKDLRNYLNKTGIMEKRNEKHFDIEKSLENLINNIKKSEDYIKATELEKNKLLKEPIENMHKFEAIVDSTSAIVTTAGSAFSIALLAPILRNTVASQYQKIMLEHFSEKNKEEKQTIAPDIKEALQKQTTFKSQSQIFLNKFRPYTSSYRI